MTLIPGYRITVASKFHTEADWPTRLAIGAGVEESGGRFFPRGPWRIPTAEDLAALVTRNAPTSAPRSLPLVGESGPPLERVTDATDAISLFQLPGHLRDSWSDLLDEAAASGGTMNGFDAFATRVGEFLRFKQLDVPPGARMEAIVTAAGERSIRRDVANARPAGLGPTVAPWARWRTVAEVAVAKLWGVVNLGDEFTSVVLVNLPLPKLAEELALRGVEVAADGTVGELVSRFLLTCPDYPLVRVRLDPGEGCRVPPTGLIFDGDPTRKEEPDVLLLISEDAADTRGEVERD